MRLKEKVVMMPALGKYGEPRCIWENLILEHEVNIVTLTQTMIFFKKRNE